MTIKHTLNEQDIEAIKHFDTYYINNNFKKINLFYGYALQKKHFKTIELCIQKNIKIPVFKVRDIIKKNDCYAYLKKLHDIGFDLTHGNFIFLLDAFLYNRTKTIQLYKEMYLNDILNKKEHQVAIKTILNCLTSNTQELMKNKTINSTIFDFITLDTFTSFLKTTKDTDKAKFIHQLYLEKTLLQKNYLNILNKI